MALVTAVVAAAAKLSRVRRKPPLLIVPFSVKPPVTLLILLAEASVIGPAQLLGTTPSLRNAPKLVGPAPLIVRASAPMLMPPVNEREAAPTMVPPRVEPRAE